MSSTFHLRSSRTVARALSGVFTALATVGVWQIVADVMDFESLPSPSAVLGAAQTLATGPELWRSLGHTLTVVLVSWVVATFLGATFGLLMGLSERINRVSSTTVELLRPLPAIGFIPAAVVVFGLSERVEILIATYAALWPVLINTAGGVHNVHPRLGEVGHAFSLTRRQIASKIVLPAALPAVLVGARLSLGAALVVTVAVEMVGVPAGLGYQIVASQQAFQPAQTYVYILLAGIVGVLLNTLTVRVVARALPGVAALAGR